MADWSPDTCAGTSSFGMSGTNAYATAVHPDLPSTAATTAKPPIWQRLRCRVAGAARFLVVTVACSM